MKPGWHKYLIYISLLFLVVALYKLQYLEFPRIYSPVSMALSIVCLFGGFVVNTIAQQRLLEQANYPVNIREALAMVGLYVFGKYIPGKVWMVMGKAMYIAEKKNYPVTDLSLLFVHAQIIGLWCGLTLGICGLWVNDALHFISWVGLIVLSVFSLVLFSKTAHNAALNLINRVLNKDFSLPVIDISKAIALVPWFLLGWLLWGSGFLLLTLSITDHIVPISTVFCFPLAGTLGILFVLAPGGIGIREGIITGYLTLLTISLPEAITISAVSRLWFLFGELFIFIVGYLASRKDNPNLSERQNNK